MHKLDETDFGNSQTESWSGKLGGTDSLISVGPKRYERETESLHCNLGGTDRSSRFDRNVTKRKQRDYNPISVRPRSLSVRSNLLGFLAVAMSTELGGSGYEISVGPSLTFWIRTYVEVRKWLRALEHITKHFEQASH